MADRLGPLIAAGGPMLDDGALQARRHGDSAPSRPPGGRAENTGAPRLAGDQTRPTVAADLAAGLKVLPLSDWSVQDVVAWLNDEVGIAHSTANFRRAQIDGLILPYLDGPALSDLGVTSPVQQRAVLAAVRAVAAASSESVESAAGAGAGARRVRSWGTREVSRWLADVVGLPRYCQSWESAAIDGTVLCCLDRDSLAELGVSSALHRSLVLAEVQRLNRTLAPAARPKVTPEIPARLPEPQLDWNRELQQMGQTGPKPEPEPEPEREPELDQPSVVIDAPVVVVGHDYVAGIRASPEEAVTKPPVNSPQRSHQDHARLEVLRWQREQEQQARADAQRLEQEREHRKQETERKQAQRVAMLRREEQQLTRQRQQRHQQHEEQEQQRRQQQTAHLAVPDVATRTTTPSKKSPKAHKPHALAPPPLVHSWDPGDVGSWIVQSMRLPQYAGAFVKHEIDGALLAVLDEDSLSELGVRSAFHRLKIIHGVQKLRAVAGEAAAQPVGDTIFSVPSWGTPVRNPGTSKGAAAEAIRAAKQEHAAATTLQAAERGRRARARGRTEAQAATRLQSVARGRAARAELARQAAAATVLQRATRARAERITRTRVERARQRSVKPLVAWSVAEVTSWLEHTVGLAEYVPLFEQHEVDGTLLSYLDKSALEELGVPSALHRLKLLTALAQLPAVQHSLAEMSAESDAPVVASGATADNVRRATLGLDLDWHVVGDVPRLLGTPGAMPLGGGGMNEQSWATVRDTPLRSFRLVQPTPTRGAAATGRRTNAEASPRLRELEHFQHQQLLAHERQQQEQGVLGGLMRYQQNQQHSELLAENELLRQRLEEAELLLAAAAASAPQRVAGTNAPILSEAVPPALPSLNASSPHSATSDNGWRGESPTLAVFLQPWYEKLREDLDELGVEAVDDFKELDAEDLDRMASKLKKVQAKKFLKHISSVVAASDS